MKIRHQIRSSKRGAVLPRALTVAFIAVMLLVAGLPGVSLSQTTASIKVISPSVLEGEKPIVSDKQATNGTYRLSAWVKDAPANAVVEFELISAADPVTGVTNLGAAEQLAPDTFELQWDASGATTILDGEYTLKAILYDAATSAEIASDTVGILLLRGAPGSGTGAAEAIDATYPGGGGAFGLHASSRGTTAGVIDFEQTTGYDVRAYYSVSQPGTSPRWKLCNDGEIERNQGDGVRCTLQPDDPATPANEADTALEVTAVAVLVVDRSGQPQAADATRVLPYLQEASRMTSEIRTPKTGDLEDTPGSTRQDLGSTGTFPCSDTVWVKVEDQLGHKMAGANIDAHATGPSDQLKFDTGWLTPPGGSRTNEPPDKGHGSTEAGFKCSSAHDNRGDQGEHGVIGAADLKHIESTRGTSDGGRFPLRVRSDQAGSTQLTVWADSTEDDVFCDDETDAMAALALSWGEETPPAVPLTPRDCTSPSPDPSVSEEPVSPERSITMTSDRTRVRPGRNVHFAGVIVGDNACAAEQVVKLKARRAGNTKFRTIVSGTSDTTGSFGFEIVAKRTKEYRAVAPVTEQCYRAASTPVTVEVRGQS